MYSNNFKFSIYYYLLINNIMHYKNVFLYIFIKLIQLDKY